MKKYFFTFGGDHPYANCYVEVHVSDGFPLFGDARAAMIVAHGTNWGFQYSEDKFEGQPEQYGLKRLSLLQQTSSGWRAVEVMGEE